MNNKSYLRFLLGKARAGSNILLFELARYRKEVLRAIPVVPKSSSINITDNCNSRCITCNMWRNKSTDELSLAEIQDILIQLKDMGIRLCLFANHRVLFPARSMSARTALSADFPSLR